MNRFQKLTLGTAAATVTLFAVGGLVRGTGSGLGCSRWPHCHDAGLLPSISDTAGVVEYAHRGMAALVIVLLAIQLVAIVRSPARRHTASLLWPTLVSVPLVLAQAGLGAVVVATDLDPTLVTVHFATAMALVACVVLAAVNAVWLDDPDHAPVGDGADPGFTRAAAVVAIATLVLLLLGTFVRASNSGLAFTDWPLMDGKLFPTPFDGPAAVMFAHRLAALIAGAATLWVLIRARNAPERSGLRVRLSTIAAVLFTVQVLVGAAQVWTRLEAWAVVLHVALSATIWALLVALWTASRRIDAAAVEVADPAEVAGRGASWKDTVTAYWQLTKPRIIVLLLITTVPAMILAARGMPSPLADPRHADRRRDRGGLGQRDQLLPRPRHRRDHEAHPPASAARAPDHAAASATIRIHARRDLVPLPGHHRERAGRVARAVGDRLLRLRLHDVAEAHRPPRTS